jgi:hypothetical protein
MRSAGTAHDEKKSSANPAQEISACIGPAMQIEKIIVPIMQIAFTPPAS